MLHDSVCPDCGQPLDACGYCTACDWCESDEPLTEEDLRLLVIDLAADMMGV